jgi:hypothetical protein
MYRVCERSSSHVCPHLFTLPPPVSNPCHRFVVGRFVGLRVLLGNHSDARLLLHAGADRAHGIVVFPQQLHSSKASSSGAPVANEVVDSSSILLFNMAKSLKSNVCCFVEMAEKRSFGFLTRDSALLDMPGLARCVRAAATARFVFALYCVASPNQNLNL